MKMGNAVGKIKSCKYKKKDGHANHHFNSVHAYSTGKILLRKLSEIATPKNGITLIVIK